MISFQKSAVLLFVLALVVLMLAPESANSAVFRAVNKRKVKGVKTPKNPYNPPNNPSNNTTPSGPAQLVGGVWKGKNQGEATFFSIGLGACGKYNTDNDMVCAIPHGMFDPSPNGNPNLNPNCGKQMIVCRGERCVTVTIVDRCEACVPGDVDLSPKAFGLIAKPEEGRVKVDCTYLGSEATPVATPTP
jgi:predicted RNA-binding Zn-ribbon protein involved in translation (DUF1610 family)